MSFRPQLAYFLGGALSFGLALVAAKHFRKPPRGAREGAALGEGTVGSPSYASPLVDSSAWGTAEVVDVDELDDEPPPELVIDSSVADGGFVDARFAESGPRDVRSSSAPLEESVALEDPGVAWLPDATQVDSTKTPPPLKEAAKADDAMEDITDLSGRPTDPMLGEIFATRFEGDELLRR